MVYLVFSIRPKCGVPLLGSAMMLGVVPAESFRCRDDDLRPEARRKKVRTTTSYG